jgi:pyrroline-5-carboxylate reductase
MPGSDRPYLVVGGGKMGEALLAGWLGHGVARARLLVVEPSAERRVDLARTYGITAVGDATELDPAPVVELLLVAVKPQVMDRVLPAYAARIAPDTLVLSIAAGKPIATLERLLARRVPVVRAMPNTPAAVGAGVTVLCANAAATPAHRALAQQLMGMVGTVHWVDDEDLFHAVTAVSGSGPAYVFLLIEAMATAGMRAGLPEPLAMALARATVAGAGELARRSEASASRLRTDVTSPGGTTEAALAVLMAPDGIGPLLERAVAAAARRSRELA